MSGRGRGAPAGAGDDDDAGVPLAAEGGDAPPPQGLATRAPARASASRAPAGTAGRRSHDLGHAADEQAGVEHHHDRVVPRPVSTPPCVDAHAALRFETTSSASRSSPTSTTSSGEPGSCGRLQSAAQQHQLGAEAGAHRQQHARTSRARAVVGEHVGEDVQHRGRAKVADRGRASARSTPSASRSSLERLLHRVEHLRAARVGDPPADVGAGQALVGEEAGRRRRARCARTRSGTSAPRTMRSPVAPTSQPMARSVSG